MTIRRSPHGIMPRLTLEGKWLNELNFNPGILVSVVYRDACLTLSTNHTVPNTSSVICVTSRLIRGRERTQLILDGFLLKRYGIHAR